MAERFNEISAKHRAFIEKQHLFFVGTAAPDGRVNISPKGLDSLRVLGPKRVVWLNLTGSGNETAAHLRENDRMTLMFCSFERAPLILRLYGHALMLYPGQERWDSTLALFPPRVGVRQLFELEVDLVQTSCGFAVPFFEFAGERQTAVKWAEQLGEEGVRAFAEKYNRLSLDGKPIP